MVTEMEEMRAGGKALPTPSRLSIDRCDANRNCATESAGGFAKTFEVERDDVRREIRRIP